MRTYLLVLWLLALAACSQEQAVGVRPMHRDVTEAVYASATVLPADYYRVYAEAAGVVEATYAVAGDTVGANQLILRVRNRTQDLQSANARLSLDQARADLTGNDSQLDELGRQINLARQQYRQDSLDLARQQELWKQKIGSRRQVEQLQLAARAAQLRLQTAQDQYEQARRRLQTQVAQARNNLSIIAGTGEQLNVRSRLAGRLYELNVEAGETVGPQQPLASIGRTDSFIVVLQVDEADISRIQLGQRVYLSLESYADSVFQARVSKIYPSMDARSQTFRVEAEFVERPPLLYPNLSAEANVVIRTRSGVLTIPRAYLLPGDSVLLAEGQRRAVRTGVSDLQWVEISSGLDTATLIYQPQ